MSTAQEYINSNARIDGRRVGMTDLMEITEWCGGESLRLEEDGIRKTVIILTDDIRAYIGDWILTNGETWQVFTDEEYRAVFVPVIVDREKFGRVLELVRTAMAEAGAELIAHNGVNWPMIAENIAMKLMNVI